MSPALPRWRRERMSTDTRRLVVTSEPTLCSKGTRGHALATASSVVRWVDAGGVISQLKWRRSVMVFTLSCPVDLAIWSSLIELEAKRKDMATLEHKAIFMDIVGIVIDSYEFFLSCHQKKLWSL